MIKKDSKDIKIDDFFLKKYGENSVFSGKKFNKQMFLSPWETGIESLDYILGGGIPQGQIIELFGKQGCGKTTLAVQIAAHLQEKYKLRIFFIDAEMTLEPSLCKNLNVNLDLWKYIPQPKSLEQTFSLINDIAEKQFANLVIVDSVPALTPKSYSSDFFTNLDVNRIQPGSVARGFSVCLVPILSVLRSNKVTVIFINQYRDYFNKSLFGPKFTTPGGHALKYYSFVRLELTVVKTLFKDESRTLPKGANVRIRTIKNKLSFPFRSKTLELSFGYGFKKHVDILNLAIELKIIIKRGSWLFYREEELINLGQRKVVLEKIKTDVIFQNKMLEQIRLLL